MPALLGADQLIIASPLPGTAKTLLGPPATGKDGALEKVSEHGEVIAPVVYDKPDTGTLLTPQPLTDAT